MKAFRTLHADEIELRVGQVTKDKTRKSLLLYKDARCDMAMLDECVGSFNWQRMHKEIKGVIYCGVSIRDESTDEWVTKWDAGTESNTEAQKGEASDSFKRACVNWGIGRELYTAPQIWVPESVNTYDLRVSVIEYTDKREIKDLVIVDGNGKQVWANKKSANTASAPRMPSANIITKPAQENAPKTQENGKSGTDEYLDILADIDAATTLEQLRFTMEAAKNSKYYEALRTAANNRALKNGWTK